MVMFRAACVSLSLPMLLVACRTGTGGEMGPQKRLPGEVECRRAAGPIRIDGLADEESWKLAEVVENFSTPWLGAQDRPAAARTRARLLWDDEAIYFFAEMEDRDLFADIMEHDGRIWENDVFEFFLKPSVDKPGYYEFHISPAGTKLDIFFPRRGESFDRCKSADEFDYRAAVVLDGTLNARADSDRGWSAEGRIAWSGFAPTGGRPPVEDVWTFAFCRYDYTAGRNEPELSTCAPLRKRSFHAHEDYRPLRFTGAPRR